MTWTTADRRQRAIEAALEHASEHPEHAPDPDRIPSASAVFSTTEQLLVALQYRWTRLLTGKIGFAQAGIEQDPLADKVETVRQAWQEAAEAEPVLRDVLNRHSASFRSDELARALDRERRMLALTSGLADRGEPTAEISRAGTALLRLFRATEHCRQTHQLTAASS